jgi:hypothetical protein
MTSQTTSHFCRKNGLDTLWLAPQHRLRIGLGKYDYNIMIQPLVALIVLAIVFCSGMLGMQASRILPQHHLADDTKAVITMSMGVVGTLSALVLGLLVAAASGSFNTRNQEILQISTDAIQVDHLLRRYGSEASGVRDLLRRYIAMKIQDLFPEGASNQPSLNNPRTVTLLEELQDRLVALEGSNANQRWLQSQGLQLLSSISATRWLLAEQNTIGIAVPLLVLVVFWLAVLFLSFGLFAPRNGTAIMALFLCALAVAGAIEMTLELNAPFQGIIRISSSPMKHALDEISLK